MTSEQQTPAADQKARQNVTGTMGAAGDIAAPARPSTHPASGIVEQVVSDIRRRENLERDTSTRGAGSGENAVLTRDRNYNETVPGAFPALISPNPQQAKTIRETQAAEDAERVAREEEAAPALVPHSSIERPRANDTTRVKADEKK